MKSGLVVHSGAAIKLIGYCWIYLLHLDPQAPVVKERKRSPRLSILGMQQFVPHPFHFDRQSSDHNPLYAAAQHGMKQKRHCPCPMDPSVSRDTSK